MLSCSLKNILKKIDLVWLIDYNICVLFRNIRIYFDYGLYSSVI